MKTQAIIDSAAKVLGVPVDDAIVVSKRSNRFPIGMTAGALIGGLIGFGALKGGVVGDGVFGGILGLAFWFGQQPRIIAKTGSRLALLSSSQWRIQATAFIRELAVEDVQLTGKGLVNKTLMVAGEKHVVAKALVARLAVMLGRPA